MVWDSRSCSQKGARADCAGSGSRPGKLRIQSVRSLPQAVRRGTTYGWEALPSGPSATPTSPLAAQTSLPIRSAARRGSSRPPPPGVGDEQQHRHVRRESAQLGVQGEEFGEHVEGHLARGAVMAADDDLVTVAVRPHDVGIRAAGPVPGRGSHLVA